MGASTFKIDCTAFVSESEEHGNFVELHWTAKVGDGATASGCRIGQISRRLNHVIKMDKQFLRRHGHPTGKDAAPVVCWIQGKVFIKAMGVVPEVKDITAMKKTLKGRGVSIQQVLF